MKKEKSMKQRNIERKKKKEENEEYKRVQKLQVRKNEREWRSGEMDEERRRKEVRSEVKPQWNGLHSTRGMLIKMQLWSVILGPNNLHRES